MSVARDQTRRIEVIEHPALLEFNHEFGTDSDLSRYEKIRSRERTTYPEIALINQLQVNFYIPTRTALLLKSNLQDIPFVTHTTRSILYELKQSGKIGGDCFTFLHAKINKQDFYSVFRYLYIVMLYSKIAETHDHQMPGDSFRFESVSSYSDKLVNTASPIVDREELSLQGQFRREFIINWLTEITSQQACSQETRKLATAAQNTLYSYDPHQFRSQFISLLDKLGNSSELEKICSKELKANISPFQGEEFFNQAYIRLKTDSYYKNCLSRVIFLKQSLEQTGNDDLLALSERCKKAYNGCVYLLSDSKNMSVSSSMRLAALTGKMRTEWQSINHIFNRAQVNHSHRFCACQVQTPPGQNELATWPFNTHTLIDLKPAQSISQQQVEQTGISMADFAQNQKKTVAIFGNTWGGGHMEASRGIANNLASFGYHPITVDLPELLMSEDVIRNMFITRWLSKNWSTGTLFEGLLKEKAFAFINFLRWAKSKLFSPFGYSENEFTLVMQQLLKLNPDSVITTWSGHNESIMQACKILGIPCMYILTDVDSTIETRDTPASYKHFKTGFAFDAPEAIVPSLKTTSAEQRFICGPPVRHAFTQHRTAEDVRRFKEKWGIETSKKVVVISSGKNGAFSPYAEILAQKYAHVDPNGIPIHLVVICGGGNKDFKRHLEQNVQPRTKLPMTIELSFDEEKMEELVSMASYGGILVGKAGGGTVFESFAKGARILIDNVPTGLFFQGMHHFCITIWEKILNAFGFDRQLPWEKVNMSFAKKHGLSESFKEEKEFLPKLEQMLNNDGLPVPLSIEVKNIEKEIPMMLQQMMVQTEADPEAQSARASQKTL